jgi:hypothetical protein
MSIRTSCCVLPDDLMSHTLSFVSLEDVERVMFVCRTFREAISNGQRREFFQMMYLNKRCGFHDKVHLLFVSSKRLILSGLIRQDIRLITDAFTRGFFSECVELCVARNELNDKDLLILFESIRSGCLKNLGILNLCSNNFTSAGWDILAEGIRDGLLASLYYIMWHDNLEQPTTQLKQICRSNRPYIRLLGLQ